MDEARGREQSRQRLSGTRAVARRVRFTMDGRTLEGLEGESVAAALAASGVRALRRARSGAPRGLWCGMGACFECVVAIDGQPERRACLEKLRDGMRVESAPPALPRPIAPPAAAAPDRRDCDVLVVGAGPAGLEAARAAAKA
ncbi:MAG: (2Fe-2S)-binding protein, partial [Alphaproteobacteria bacterium]